jgi:anti-sigma B factor antagonist
VTLLDIRVTATEAGPLMALSGEADVTTVAQLQDALNGQLATGIAILLVEVSGLRFADSATIGALIGAARKLEARGGRLSLLNPQPALARMLDLLGADRILACRHTGPEPTDDGGPVF